MSVKQTSYTYLHGQQPNKWRIDHCMRLIEQANKSTVLACSQTSLSALLPSWKPGVLSPAGWRLAGDSVSPNHAGQVWSIGSPDRLTLISTGRHVHGTYQYRYQHVPPPPSSLHNPPFTHMLTSVAGECICPNPQVKLIDLGAQYPPLLNHQRDSLAGQR